MDQQERNVISGIFQRLEQVANQPRDAEAERLIGDYVQKQPYAPYAMAQTIHVQEQALLNLNEQVKALQAEMKYLQSQPQGSGGFLSGLFGGGASRPQPDPRAAMSAHGQQAPSRGGSPTGAGPWGGGRMQNMAMGQQAGGPWGARQSGGFLQSAMATAAGVAGGMVLANVLTNAFSGASPADAVAALTDPAATASEASANEPAHEPTSEPIADHAAYEPEPDHGADYGGDFGGDGGGDWA
jgi:uncharacterized protein